jgi:hypothetical protein
LDDDPHVSYSEAGGVSFARRLVIGLRVKGDY